MAGQYQAGPGRGNGGIGIQAGVDVEASPGGLRDVVSPKTEMGQAMLLAAIGALVLLVVVGRRQENWAARVGAVAELVLVITAAMWVSNWATRTYVLRHPTGPLADGLRLDQ